MKIIGQTRAIAPKVSRIVNRSPGVELLSRERVEKRQVLGGTRRLSEGDTESGGGVCVRRCSEGRCLSKILNIPE